MITTVSVISGCSTAKADRELSLEYKNKTQFPVIKNKHLSRDSYSPYNYLTTRIDYNLKMTNEHNRAENKSIVGNQNTQTPAENSVYSIKFSMLPYILVHYKLDHHKTIDFDIDYNTGKLKSLMLDFDTIRLSCTANDKINTCDHTFIEFDKNTGNSKLVFKSQSFILEAPDNSESMDHDQHTNRTLIIDGYVYGSIEEAPVTMLSLQPTSSGWIEIDNNTPDISRVFLAFNELIFIFLNGDQLRLSINDKDTGSSHSFISGVNNQVYRSLSPINVKKLEDDRIKVNFDNLDFIAESPQKHYIKGEITLKQSKANLSIPELNLVFTDTNFSQINNILNDEITYLAMFYKEINHKTPVALKVTVKDKTVIAVELKQYTNNANNQYNGEVFYSCDLAECKNFSISKDGTTIEFNKAPLTLSATKTNEMIKLFGITNISITGKITTNVR